LNECDYPVLEGRPAHIVEAARKQAFKKFIQDCPDEALNTCATAIYNFSITPIGPDQTLEDAERDICAILEQNVWKIKYDKAQRFYQKYLDCFRAHGKISEAAIFNLAYEMRFDIDGIGPLMYWYVLKQFEFMAVRGILLGKLFGFDRDKIMESLRGLYERF
jgi:hypothetical protein